MSSINSLSTPLLTHLPKSSSKQPISKYGNDRATIKKCREKQALDVERALNGTFDRSRLPDIIDRVVDDVLDDNSEHKSRHSDMLILVDGLLRAIDMVRNTEEKPSTELHIALKEWSTKLHIYVKK
jgi:hypothetical protein